MTDPDQLTRTNLAGMTPDQIEAARLAGRLDDLLGIPRDEHDALAAARGDAPLNLEHVRHLARLGHHDQIEAARAAGRITYSTTEGA